MSIFPWKSGSIGVCALLVLGVSAPATAQVSEKPVGIEADERDHAIIVELGVAGARDHTYRALA